MKEWLFAIDGVMRYAKWDGVSLETDSAEVNGQIDILVAEGVIVECGEIGYPRTASLTSKVRGWGTINRAIIDMADADSISFPFSYFPDSCLPDEDLQKASFGGDRSAAGRYAAEQRWKGHANEENAPDTRQSGYTTINLANGKQVFVDEHGTIHRANRYGSLKPTILIDYGQITADEKKYIKGGDSAPERVKRRFEVIDKYAKTGVDVTKPARKKVKGGKQWLDEIAVKSIVSQVLKASFGGDRSAAGRYAANMRWRGHVKEDGSDTREAIGRVRAMVAQLGLLETVRSAEIDPADWESSTGSLFVKFAVPTGELLIPTAAVMTVETEVRALGKKLYEKIMSENKIITPEEVKKITDDATAERNATLDKLDGALIDLSENSPEYQKAVDDLSTNEAEYSRVSRQMIAATKAYKQAQKDGNREAQTQAYKDRQTAKSEKAFLKRRIDRSAAVINGVMHSVYITTPSGRVIALAGVAKFADKQYQDQIAKTTPAGIGLIGAVQKLVEDNGGTGGELQVKYDSTTKFRPNTDPTAYQNKMVESFKNDVRTRMPRSWVDDVNNYTNGQLTIDTSNGGGSWSDINKKIMTSGESQTNLHEFIHAAMYANPVRTAIEHAHLVKRTTGSASDSIDAPIGKKIIKGRQAFIGKAEYKGTATLQGKYIRDKFVDPYAGRIYDYGRGTEVVTTAHDMLGKEGWRAKALNGAIDLEQIYLLLGMLVAT